MVAFPAELDPRNYLSVGQNIPGLVLLPLKKPGSLPVGFNEGRVRP